MGFLDFLKRPDINQEVQNCANISNAVILDVRTSQEYREGHIPGSRNVPLQLLDGVEEVTDRKDTPIFVYCYSGSRSHQAAGMLAEMGYTNVKNLGGISDYRGKVEY